MNCEECKLEISALLDSVIKAEEIEGLIDHLTKCPDCSEDYRQSREIIAILKPSVNISAPSLLKQNVINQLIKDEAKMKNETFKSVWLNSRMKKVLSIAAVLLIAMMIVPFTFRSNLFMSSTVKAADKLIAMSINAAQSVRSMVINMKVRTVAKDNFDLVGTEYEMVNHTITKSFENPVKWKIDKGERVVVFDGVNQYLWMPRFDEGIKAGPNAGFVSWMKILLDPREILSKEQNIAKEKNSKIRMKENGDEILLTITSKASGNFINDYCKNKTIEESDNRREYVFDANSKLLKELKIYILDGKKETLILETEKIDYNIAVDPSVYVISLPQGVEWKEGKRSYNSETFKNITSKRAAELFFQGMADNNWQLVGEACDFFNNESEKVKRVKDFFGGLTVIKIGEPFKSGLFPGEFVPYEIKFKSGDVKKFNLALKNNNPNKVWEVSGGF